MYLLHFHIITYFWAIIGPSLGQSNKKVWQLIKESVPAEKSFGDACISKKHCNFFVNKGNAKFEDMKKLIEFVSENVLAKTGVKLETEIKILE